MSFGNPFAAGQENDFGALGLGFNGFEVSLNFVSGNPDPNVVANSTLKLMFKSLLKRDDITKEKALNELLLFVTADNLNELKDDLVLITWIQLYPKLTVSESKSVRALSHQVHCSFISLLQRSFAKYLKDSIPVLLSGIYDIDSSVTNTTLKSLGKVFNNDQQKINNLWILFSKQILNFIDQVFNKETVDTLSDDRFVPRDEAEFKYLRLVNSAISMISHLIQLSSKLNEFDSRLEDFQKVFDYENLWHYLLVNSNNNNQRIFKSLLSLINAVLKLKPELLNDKAWKYLSKRFLKSLTFVKKLDSNPSNNLLYSSIIVPILSTLTNLNNSNPQFYDFDKNSREKVLGFLKIGSLNSDPSYYEKLSEYLKSSHVIDLSQESIVVQPILLKNFQTEVDNNLKFRAGADYIINSLLAYLQVASLFESPDDSFKAILDEALKVKAPISNKFVDPLVKYIPDSVISEKLDSFDQDVDFNISILLKIALSKQTSLGNALTRSLDSLRAKSTDCEDGSSFANHPAFEIFQFAIVENQDTYKEVIEEFLDELPTFITTLVIDKPIELLIKYSKSSLYNKELFIETFDSFIVKLTMLGSKDSLLNRLDQFSNKSELLTNSEELQSTINEFSSTYDFTDDGLFKPHLINNQSVLELYKIAEDQDRVDIFLDFYFKYNSENEELFRHLIKSTDLIEKHLWTGVSLNDKLNEALESLLSESEIQSRYIESLKTHVALNGTTDAISSEASRKISKFPELFELLFDFDALSSELVEVYGDTIDSRLSLGNPLETNIYLLNTKQGSFPVESIKPIINYAFLLAKLDYAQGISDKVLLYLGIVSEISVDYGFLASVHHGDFLLSLKERVDEFLVLSRFGEFAEVLDKLFSKESVSSFMDLLSVDESNQVLAFYKARLLLVVLNSLKSKQTGFNINEVDLLKFDKFIKLSIRSKDVDSILKFIAVISSISELLPNEKLERTRNLIGSELIGLRSSEILDNGLAKLTILNNFLIIDESDDEYTPLQPQRLNMILNELNKWVDSDISFEEGFEVLRIQLLKTLNLLVTFKPLRGNGNLVDLSVRLLQDSIGLINIGEGDNLSELTYHSLKLFLNLKKYDVVDKDSVDEISDELLEFFIESEERSDSNQPTVIIDELLNRFLSTVPAKKFQKYFEVLVGKYFKITKFENKRILLKILETLILSRQQDLVIEFELNKNEDNIAKFQIPEIFIKNVSNPPNLNNDLDDDNYNQLLIDYLWNWKLILVHFKEITLNLRNLYIKQLQNYNGDVELISRFLGFLSSYLILEIDDKDYLKDLQEDNDIITSYTYDDISDLSKEAKNLSINIYYTILNGIGSLSVNWFNNIKDRGFKAKFEAFTITYISPNLIKDKISQFQSKVNSFTSKDENLTIKINKLTNEIKATYLIDEQYLEVIFKIPESFPLKNIEISGPQRIGVKEQQWKAWILSSQRIISLTNGEIDESLEFFLKNVKFHFKGFEECAICYSILHSDNSLPSKKCSTCDNKFHAGCLYKWFKSSGGNTCPLCRSTFNFK
jgi:hypothetical protein